MKRQPLTIAAAALFTMMASGCATVSTVDSSDTVAIQDALEPGVRISARTPENQWHDLTVAGLSETGISAMTRDQAIVTIPYEDLTGLDVIEPKPARTALGLSGAFAFSAAVAVHYPAYVLASVLLFRD